MPVRHDGEPKPRDSREPIVFYDGTCGLCHGFVQFMIRHDRSGVIRFAPLQGDTAARQVPAYVGSDLASVVFRDEDGVVFSHSTAALHAIARLGGPWRLASLLLLIPRWLRDAVYRYVARHRYGWFGTADSCALPAPAVRQRFLS
jgi:predicted DCC family thiol-disulfide oxidoreductase YuxK